MLDPFCRMSSTFLRYREKIRDPRFQSVNGPRLR
jgi:hypothetical protein